MMFNWVVIIFIFFAAVTVFVTVYKWFKNRKDFNKTTIEHDSIELKDMKVEIDLLKTKMPYLKDEIDTLIEEAKRNYSQERRG